MIREICKDVLFLARKSEPATPEDLPVAADLLETLEAHADGCVGMAANMIGVAKRIIAFDDGGAYALRVGVTAPFYLTKLFAPHFAPGAAVVNISSSRDRMSQPQTESYTAAKGGIAALTHALAVSLAGKVRVNSISPGWIETGGAVWTGPDAVQHPAGRVGDPLDIASMVLFLCSDRAGFIPGENIGIDGGMTRQMVYHNDFGWTLRGGNEE